MRPTVYIVDDEPMAIQYLETLLKRTKLQVELVGSASNGVKAIPEIARLHPDFVFVDISMPIMDGLEMSEKVLKNDPKQKIFILTAYKDFEYAKKSVTLGVTDYLLKNELSEKMLEDLLQKNMAELELDKRERHAIMATNMRQFLLSGSTDEQNITKYRKKTMQRYVLIYLTQKPEIFLRYTGNQINHYVDCFDLENRIQEKDIRCRAFVEMAANEYCCVLSIDANVSNIKDRCYIIARQVLERIEEEEYQCMSMISNPITQFLLLPSTYEGLKKKISCVFARKENVCFEDEQDDCDVVQDDLGDLLSEWIATVESKDADAADQSLKKYLSALRTQCDVWGYSERIQSLYYYASNKIKESELPEKLIEIKNSYHDIQQLEADILRSQGLCMQELRHRSEKNFSRHVILAQKYISEHYDQDISVADIAEAAGISEGHLRRCFKKELDDSVINYLANYRITLAKKLMKKSNQSIDEICRQTGFTSGQYFSYVFKKKEGISPSEYMRAAQSSGLRG